MQKKVILIFLFILSFFPISLLFSDTIIVDTTGMGDYLTIQEGINASTDGDTVLVHPATYTENINFTGKNIIVSSLYLISQDTSYISQTIIDGNQNGSVVTFVNGEDTTAVLTGFTIKNGSSTVGGGIFCNSSSPSLEYLAIIENTANVGGGILFIQSNSCLKNLTFYGNSGSGVACNSSNISLVNCILWNDYPDEIIFYSGSISVTFSDIQGGWIGEGNIDEDPQFANPDIGNFNLTDSSSCINSGNPYSPPDPDGTRADMGAFYYYNNTSEIVADFCADSTLGFSQLTVNFTDFSVSFNCEITSWNWDFGDGETSTEQNPIHTYNSGGFYTVSLTVEDDNGNFDTKTKEDYIIVYTVIEDGESISGTWYAEDSPYLVQGDAIVFSSNTLIIEPGTLIQFYTGTSPNFDYGRLGINGTLIAQGSLNDSIVFTRYGSEGFWGGIDFGSADSTSIIEYSKIEFGTGIDLYNSTITITRNKFTNNFDFAIRCRSNSNSIINNNHFFNNNECAILVDDSNPTIINNIIKENGLLTDYTGIVCYNSSPLIENNTIDNNGGNGIYLDYSNPVIINNIIENHDWPGIYCRYYSNPNIENNTIIGNQWGGVYCESTSNPNVINNIIQENDWGIYCLNQSNPSIINNLIIDSPNDGICCDNSSPVIINNTIVYNGLTFPNCAGIFCGDNSDPIIYNTILWENSTDFDFSGSDANPIISYSLIQGSSLPSWVQDGGNNIFSEDPLFVNEIGMDFRLTDNSPCIDTGTPDTTGLNLPENDLLGNPRIYNGIIDMGAYEWQGYGVDDQGDEFCKNLYLFQNIPNPFSSYTTISFISADYTLLKDYKLSIYNARGQLIRTYIGKKDNLCEKTDIVWDGIDKVGNKVPNGLYFYKLSARGGSALGGSYGEKSVTKKMLLMR